eukprot:Hpha_TRINITY_DN15137_c0_g2::TRINITY_DN15137_c0_g2_i19::g.127564::m.127564
MDGLAEIHDLVLALATELPKDKKPRRRRQGGEESHSMVHEDLPGMFIPSGDVGDYIEHARAGREGGMALSLESLAFVRDDTGGGAYSEAAAEIDEIDTIVEMAAALGAEIYRSSEASEISVRITNRLTDISERQSSRSARTGYSSPVPNQGWNMSSEAKTEPKSPAKAPLLLPPHQPGWVRPSDEVLKRVLAAINSCRRFPEHPQQRAGDHEVNLNCGTLDVLDHASDGAPWHIADYLWLSNSVGSRDGVLLSDLGITHVVRLSEESDEEQTQSLRRSGVELVHFRAADADAAPVLLNFLVESRQVYRSAAARRGGVCVHCHAGLNRSVAICVALLMVEHGVKLLPAIVHCHKQRKNHVLVNTSFRRQLVDLAMGLKLLFPLEL